RCEGCRRSGKRVRGDRAGVSARELVASSPANLLGREGRRLLQVRAEERREGLLDRVTRWPVAGRLASDRTALGVAGIGGDTESNHGVVRLVAGLQELRETGCTADDERQDAGRRRIEGSGVADAPLAERTTHARDRLVGRRSSRLVD